MKQKAVVAKCCAICNTIAAKLPHSVILPEGSLICNTPPPLPTALLRLGVSEELLRDGVRYPERKTS